METPSKKRGRPAKPKAPVDIGFKGLEAIVDNGTTVVTITEEPTTGTYPTLQVKEVIVEKIIEVPEKKLKGFELYRKLKELRFPQGGMGQWWENPNGTDKVYVPRPEELYTMFIGDPQAWDELRDTLARTWIEISVKK
jgi:hypothetical protein